MQTAVIIIVFLANACLVGAGIYLSSYLTKKAEGLATKEDFTDLKEQTAELTRTTKKIEAEINEDLWGRQKRWELRRDAAFEAAKVSGAVKDALTALHAVYMTDKQSLAQGKPTRPEKRTEVYAAFNKAAQELDQAFVLVAITCGDEMKKKVGEFCLFTRNLSLLMVDGNPERFLEQADVFATRFTDVMKAIRSEMGLNRGT